MNERNQYVGFCRELRLFPMQRARIFAPRRNNRRVITQVRRVFTRNLSAQIKGRVQVITSGHFQVRTNVDAQLGKWIIDLIERFWSFQVRTAP